MAGAEGVGDHACLARSLVDGSAQGGGVQRLATCCHHQRATLEGRLATLGAAGERFERRADADALLQQSRQHLRRVQIAPIHRIGIGLLRSADAALRGRNAGDGAAIGGHATQARRAEVIGQRDRIGGAAIDATIGRRGLVKDGVDQAELRLGRGHHIGRARLIGAAILRDAFVQRIDLNAVRQQQVQRLAGQTRIGGITKYESL